MSKSAIVHIQSIHVYQSESYGFFGEPGSSAEWNITITVDGQSFTQRHDGVKDDSVIVIDREFNVDDIGPHRNLKVEMTGEEIDDTSANDQLPSGAKLIVPSDNWDSGLAYEFSASNDDFSYTVRFDIRESDIGTSTNPLTAGAFGGAELDAAIVWPNGKIYLFKGSRYVRYDLGADKVDPGYPSTIQGNWPGLPMQIDAFITYPNGSAYAFAGDLYYRYDIAADKVVVGYPRLIAQAWPGLPTHLSAAVTWSNGKLYAFKGTEYYRFDIAANKVDAGYPKPIGASWPGLPSHVDAAMLLPNGKAYFFEGNQYYRYDVAADKVDAGYPQLIAAGWHGV